MATHANPPNNESDRLRILSHTLSALAQELPAGKTSKELSELVSRLQRGESLEKLKEDPSALFWLSRFGLKGVEASGAAKLTTAMSDASEISLAHRQQACLLVYPIAVTIAAVLLLCVLCATIIPEFDGMYGEFGLDLPTPTLILFGLSRELSQHPIRLTFTVVAIVAGVVIVFRLWTRMAWTNRWFGSLIAGNSQSVEAMAKLTGLLAEKLEVGGSVSESLRFAGQHCNHRYYRGMAVRLSEDAHKDLSVLAESSVAGVFPQNVIAALDVGPGEPPNTVLLRELSDLYYERVRNRTNWISGLASPLIVIALGAFVMFTVISLFMPMFSLVSGLS